VQNDNCTEFILKRTHKHHSFNQNIILKHLTSYNNRNAAIILLSFSVELKIVDIANEIDLHRERVSRRQVIRLEVTVLRNRVFSLIERKRERTNTPTFPPLEEALPW